MADGFTFDTNKDSKDLFTVRCSIESPIPAVNDWRLALATGLIVAGLQGALVLAIGTDLPWWDQWG
jgi:hypothetical protein